MSRYMILYKGGVIIADGKDAGVQTMQKLGVSLPDGTAMRFMKEGADKGAWVADGYLNAKSIEGLYSYSNKYPDCLIASSKVE